MLIVSPANNSLLSSRMQTHLTFSQRPRLPERRETQFVRWLDDDYIHLCASCIITNNALHCIMSVWRTLSSFSKLLFDIGFHCNSIPQKICHLDIFCINTETILNFGLIRVVGVAGAIAIVNLTDSTFACRFTF